MRKLRRKRLEAGRNVNEKFLFIECGVCSPSTIGEQINKFRFVHFVCDIFPNPLIFDATKHFRSLYSGPNGLFFSVRNTSAKIALASCLHWLLRLLLLFPICSMNSLSTVYRYLPLCCAIWSSSSSSSSSAMISWPIFKMQWHTIWCCCCCCCSTAFSLYRFVCKRHHILPCFTKTFPFAFCCRRNGTIFRRQNWK